MASFNKVLIMGNLTRDPELRYIPSGTAVATFTVACNRNYKLPTGEKKEEVAFIRTVVWGRMGENCAEYLKKGSAVFVEGRLQSRSWEDQQGQKKSITEVNAQVVQFLGGRGTGQKSGNSEEDGFSGASNSSDAPKAASREPLEEISLDMPSEAPSPADGSDVVPF